MSTNERRTGRSTVPAPPGGHPLRIDPDAQRHVPAYHNPSSHYGDLPVVEETSAGGLVVKVIGNIPHAAVIARRNRAGRLEWCLPKGHLEGEETAEEAAIREISEETGILGVISRSLGSIDYWFTGEDRRVHKVVHHYLLHAVGGYLTVEGDPDSEAEDVAWISFDALFSTLSYANERRLAALAQDLLRDVHGSQDESQQSSHQNDNNFPARPQE